MADSQVLPPPPLRRADLSTSLRYSPRIARPPCEHCGDPDTRGCIGCGTTQSCCGCTCTLFSVDAKAVRALIKWLGTNAHKLRFCDWKKRDQIIQDLTAETTTPEEVLARHGKPGCCWP
jgi:hypothetical protein